MDDETVVLHDPGGRHFIVDGTVSVALLPLIDGTRTIGELVAALAGRHGAGTVRASLRALDEAGVLSRGEPSAGAPPTSRATASALAVRLETSGVARSAAAAAFGAVVRHATGASVQVMVTTSLDAAAVRRSHARARARGGRWVVVVLRGRDVWVGPTMESEGDAGCLACLAHRVDGNLAIDSWLRGRGLLPSTSRDVAAQWLAERPIAALGALRRAVEGRASHLVVAGPDGTTRHPVQRRPQCRVCGDGALMRRTGSRPVVPSTRRTAAPALVVSPLTGVIQSIDPIPATAGIALCTAAAAPGRRRPTFGQLRRDLAWATSGKGRYPADARRRAVGEAIERYSGVWQGDEARRRTTWSALGAGALDPTGVLLYSDRQLQSPQPWHPLPFLRVPLPFDRDATMDYSAVWRLSDGARRWLPSALLYYGHPDAERLAQCHADSNGCAAGRSMAHAVENAILELVERDAVALWWYPRSRPPQLDLRLPAGTWGRAMLGVLRRDGRTTWALDLTSDLGIPVVAALSARAGARVLMGFAAATTLSGALERALAELLQLRTAIAHAAHEGSALDGPLEQWLGQATVEGEPWLLGGSTRVGLTHRPKVARGEFVRLLAAQGIECYAVEQTRPDVGIPVVRVVAPGLRHFWPRLAPGRLYDVPRRLGWTHDAVAEQTLNCWPMFL